MRTMSVIDIATTEMTAASARRRPAMLIAIAMVTPSATETAISRAIIRP